MPDQEKEYQTWLPVIGRSLSLLCLSQVHGKNATIAEKAKFLEALGLDRKNVAELLGTSYGSVTELLRLHRKKGAKRRGTG